MSELTPEEAEEIKARFLKTVQEGGAPVVLSSTEGWARRSSPGSGHECAPPMRERSLTIPGWAAKGGQPITTVIGSEADGRYGDLWRCVCGSLWRVGSSCDYGPHDGRCPRGGYHPDGPVWRPATWWQRLRYRGRP